MLKHTKCMSSIAILTLLFCACQKKSNDAPVPVVLPKIDSPKAITPIAPATVYPYTDTFAGKYWPTEGQYFEIEANGFGGTVAENSGFDTVYICHYKADSIVMFSYAFGYIKYPFTTTVKSIDDLGAYSFRDDDGYYQATYTFNLTNNNQYTAFTAWTLYCIFRYDFGCTGEVEGTFVGYRLN